MKDFKKVEQVLKALANHRRLQIIAYTRNRGPVSVTSIAEEIKLSFRSTSRHLGVLTAANILDRSQVSTTVLYRLAKPVSPILVTALSQV